MRKVGSEMCPCLVGASDHPEPETPLRVASLDQKFPEASLGLRMGCLYPVLCWARRYGEWVGWGL